MSVRSGKNARRSLGGGLAAIVVVACGLSVQAHAARAATSPPTAPDLDAARVVALVTAGSEQLDSYVVPVHVEAKVRAFIPIHVKLDGTVYFKRPERVKLDMHLVPAQYRRLFAALGTPLTWSQGFDFTTDSVSIDGTRKFYHLRGVARDPSTGVASVLLDVPDDHLDAMHARWTCADGTQINERVYPGTDGTYDLPKRAEIETTADGLHVHADLEFGDYALNEGFPDSVFSGS